MQTQVKFHFQCFISTFGVVRNNFPSEVCLDWPLDIMHYRLVLNADITIGGCFREYPSASLIHFSKSL